MFCIHITVALLLQLIKLQLRHTVSYDLGTHCRILHHHLSTSLCICWVISDDRQGRHQSKYFFPHCNITECWPGVYHVMLIQRWEVIAECWQCRVFTALHGRGGAEWGLWVGGDLVTWGQGWCCCKCWWRCWCAGVSCPQQWPWYWSVLLLLTRGCSHWRFC